MVAADSAARLFILSGPTAVGKGTVVGSLCANYPDAFYLSVSATTRDPRPGEVEGQSYFFMTKPQFEQLIASGGLLEWAQVHGKNYYGTPAAPVDEALRQGKPVLLEIDLAGARQVKAKRPEAHTIFLKPPSWEELVRRLQGRGTESREEQLLRLNTARDELAAAPEFDEIVVNDEVHTATEQLAKIMGLR